MGKDLRIGCLTLPLDVQGGIKGGLEVWLRMGTRIERMRKDFKDWVRCL